MMMTMMMMMMMLRLPRDVLRWPIDDIHDTLNVGPPTLAFVPSRLYIAPSAPAPTSASGAPSHPASASGPFPARPDLPVPSAPSLTREQQQRIDTNRAAALQIRSERHRSRLFGEVPPAAIPAIAWGLTSSDSDD